MVISLDKLIQQYKLQINGVIHIGANDAKEYKDYVKAGIPNMMFFEPIQDNYKRLVASLPKQPNIRTYNLALGNEMKEVEMFVETVNCGQSCSILEPLKHLEQYPKIVFDKKETVRMIRLDHIPFNRDLYNMINIDVQGYELEVFKGAENTLPFIDIIYSEINIEEMYKNCVRLTELDLFLRDYEFTRVAIDTHNKTWGDALYLKQK
jgi:FkbM family methyltransferase